MARPPPSLPAPVWNVWWLTFAGLPAGEFSIEAIALLRSVYPNGSVRTLAGQWSGVPIKRRLVSRHHRHGIPPQTRMPVLTLSGTDRQGNPATEPSSAISPLQLDRSYYLGVSFTPAGQDRTGTVTFFVKDLANEDEAILTATVPHPIVSLTPPPGPLFIGARAAAGAGSTLGWLDRRSAAEPGPPD